MLASIVAINGSQSQRNASSWEALSKQVSKAACCRVNGDASLEKAVLALKNMRSIDEKNFASTGRRLIHQHGDGKKSRSSHCYIKNASTQVAGP